MKIKLNTNLIPIFSGTYESMWEVEEIENNGDCLPVDYEQKDLLRSIAQVYQENEEAICETFGLSFIKKIHFTGKSWSPREYNFNTDQIDFVMTIDKKLMAKALKELEGNVVFEKWLHEHFTSCDGFVSFTPNNFMELSEEILGEHDKYDQALSAMIRFLAMNDTESIEEDMHEEWAGNGYGGLKYTISKE